MSKHAKVAVVEDGEKEGPVVLGKTASKDAAASSGAEREITWQELAKHNKPDDMWIGLHGYVYDMTPWAAHHPGGHHILEMVAGREATHLFESYHKLSSRGLVGSQKCPKVGKLVSTEFPLYAGESKFYTSLRTKVEKYFRDNGHKSVRVVTPFVLANTLFIIGGLISMYYLIGFVEGFSMFTRVLFAIMAGCFHHLSMVHLWHDMSHYSYGDSPWFWEYFPVFGGIFVGHSMDVWRHRHVLGHHIYTNVCGVDPDLGIYKAAPTKPLKPYKRKWEAFGNNVVVLPTSLQPLLYLVIVLQMQLDDWRSLWGHSMEAFKFNNRPFWRFYVPNVIYYIQRLVLPWAIGVLSIPATIGLFLITEAVAGSLFGYFSQITHISLNVEWPTGTPIPKDWAELQVLTARDYAQDSKFWTYVSGYLNYQVMHHLFPGIAPYHYVPLLPVLKETCKEYNIPYTPCSSFWAAVKDHWKHLAQFQTMLAERDAKAALAAKEAKKAK